MRSRTIRLSFLFFLCTTLPLLATALPLEASGRENTSAKIEWEVVNPFRFIHEQSTVDYLKRVFASTSGTSLALERELQRLSEAQITDRRKAIEGGIDCAIEQKQSVVEKCFEPYLGWFSRIASNNYADTCWDARRDDFRNDGNCKDYIAPKSLAMRFWINSKGADDTSSIKWLFEGITVTALKHCRAGFQQLGCVEIEVPLDSNMEASFRAIAQFRSTPSIQTEEQVKVKDRLIVGMGDSYASGEGNPDIPARFLKNKSEKDFTLGKKLFSVVPRKDKSPKVQWMDERCHRSLYSYQFKTALVLALKNPRDSVTFFSFACSGATTDNLIHSRQNTARGRVPVQLDRVRNTVRGRRIDYLLLSTGGNDVDFARYVAFIVAPRSGLLDLNRAIGKRPRADSAIRIQKTLLGTGSGNYFRFHDAVLNPSTGLRITDCATDRPCPRILLTAYPNIVNNELGQPCEDTSSLDQPFFKDENRKERIKEIKRLVLDPLQSLQLNEIQASKLGWRVVSSHHAGFATRGFCATGPDSHSDYQLIPTRANGRWHPLDPKNYQAYGTRQRWIRLPVDSKLNADEWSKLFGLTFDLFKEDDRSSIMHPTGEGHAATADANIEIIMNSAGDFFKSFH